MKTYSVVVEGIWSALYDVMTVSEEDRDLLLCESYRLKNIYCCGLYIKL